MWSGLGRLFGRGASPRKPAPPRAPTPPPLRDRAELDALIDRCGLAEARSLIQSQATPCFHMIEGGTAPDAPLGMTRLGGAPDLPVGSEWPRSEYGLCGFLGQWDLADVRTRTGPTDLPAEGLLSIFVDFIDSAADPAPVRAVLTPPAVSLERVARPPRDADFGPYTGWLNPLSIGDFIPGIDLPTFDFRLAGQIETLAPEGDMEAFEQALWPRPAGTIGQWLGQGFDHDGTDLRLGVHAHRIGRPRLPRYDFVEDWAAWEELKTIRNRLQNGQVHQPWSDADDDDVRFLLAHRDQLKAEVESLRLLVRIESNRSLGLLINDADPIFVFAPAARLSKGDVSETWGAVTQG